MRTLEPFKGAKVVQYHPDFVYFFTGFRPGSVEDRPGIPPTPGHLVQLIEQMTQQKVRLVVVGRGTTTDWPSAWSRRRAPRFGCSDLLSAL